MSVGFSVTFSRLDFNNFNIREVLLKKVSLRGKTRGEVIFQGFYASLLEVNTPIHKLMLIITYDTQASTNENADCIELCKKKKEEKSLFPKLFSYHFVIHQEAL
jgi:hypothetical protein